MGILEILRLVSKSRNDAMAGLTYRTSVTLKAGHSGQVKGVVVDTKEY